MSTLDIRTGNRSAPDNIIVSDDIEIRSADSENIVIDESGGIIIVKFDDIPHLKAALDKAQELWGGK